MAATVEIDEQNGSSGAPTLTHNISNCNMGPVDSPNLDPTQAVNAVDPGNNTMEKWQKLHVTAMGGASSINQLKIWRTGSLSGAALHKTNCRTSAYGGNPAYATPVTTDSVVATQDMPSAAPSSANLGIAGSLSSSLTAIGSSDFCVHQIQTDATDVGGNTTVMNYQYREVQ